MSDMAVLEEEWGSPARAQQRQQGVPLGLGGKPGPDAVQLVDAFVAVAGAQLGLAAAAGFFVTQLALPAVGKDLA